MNNQSSGVDNRGILSNLGLPDIVWKLQPGANARLLTEAGQRNDKADQYRHSHEGKVNLLRPHVVTQVTTAPVRSIFYSSISLFIDHLRVIFEYNFKLWQKL